MNIKEFKAIINNLPDETIIEINSIWSREKIELEPSSICEAHYDEKKKKVFITPEKVSYL